MERNLIGELNIMKEMGIKPNFSDVARRYGVDRHTVSKYWNGGGAQPDDGRSGRASCFDGLRDEIEGRAQMPGTTAKGIHEWLLDRHSGDGRRVAGYNAFTHWLRTRGVEVGVAAGAEAHPRFETAPGEQLQFDWKEDLAMRGRDGAEYRFNVFSATLGFSRLHVFLRSMTKSRDDLLRCLYLTIALVGGVCRLWLTDNMPAVVTVGADGTRRRDPRVERFAREAGFELVLSRPRTGVVPEHPPREEVVELLQREARRGVEVARELGLSARFALSTFPLLCKALHNKGFGKSAVM